MGRDPIAHDNGPLQLPLPAMTATLLPGFEHRRLRTNATTIHVASAGSGPAVLMLHGWPQTLAMWHAIAPALASHHSVVCADLRGYGDSAKPRGLPDHSNYSKRVMAADMVGVMQRLGHERFHVIGHDRGARVAHRLARDHGERVLSLTVIDICPTLAMYERTDMAFARAYYHWFLFIQPAPLPEQMIAAIGFDGMFNRLTAATGGRGGFDAHALAEYRRCFDRRTIHASCEDYRAAASIDLEHDRADAGRKITMPVLALWGRRSVVGTMFDCLADWRAVAENVRGQALDCGHFVPEEKSQPTLAALQRFLRHARGGA
jgi:haloacetate dehalogenase